MSGHRRIVILGAAGQVGRAVAQLAAQRSLTFLALTHADCDVADAAALARAIAAADIVINGAALAQVERAETATEAAYRVNAAGVENAAAACVRTGAALVHLSTDYVFDGAVTRPLREDDPTRPLNVYGRSKLAGELAVRARLPRHIILRVSRIFGGHRSDFVKATLQRANERCVTRVVDDQIGGPTPMPAVAEAILTIAAAIDRQGFADWGTYHFCGEPAVSWYDFARAILADRPEAEIRPISTREFASPAPRPLYGQLDCSRIARVFGIVQPQWRPALRTYLAELRRASPPAADCNRPSRR